MSARHFFQRLLLLAALTAAGCTVSDRDVSDDPRFRIGYRPGEVYRLVQPVALVRIDNGYFELVPPGESRAYGKPAGTLAAGTHVRIVSLHHTVTAAPIQWESGVTTTAQILDRPAWTVALHSVSGVQWVRGDRGTRTGVLVPDPQWLAPITPAGDDGRP